MPGLWAVTCSRIIAWPKMRRANPSSASRPLEKRHNKRSHGRCFGAVAQTDCASRRTLECNRLHETGQRDDFRPVSGAHRLWSSPGPRRPQEAAGPGTVGPSQSLCRPKGERNAKTCVHHDNARRKGIKTSDGEIGRRSWLARQPGAANGAGFPCLRRIKHDPGPEGATRAGKFASGAGPEFRSGGHVANRVNWPKQGLLAATDS